jgi:hypothetical protein
MHSMTHVRRWQAETTQGALPGVLWAPRAARDSIANGSPEIPSKCRPTVARRRPGASCGEIPAFSGALTSGGGPNGDTHVIGLGCFSIGWRGRRATSGHKLTNLLVTRAERGIWLSRPSLIATTSRGARLDGPGADGESPQHALGSRTNPRPATITAERRSPPGVCGGSCGPHSPGTGA